MGNQPVLKVNLPDSLHEASFFTTDPFPIFEIDNFIDEDFYRLLSTDVNSRQTFDRVFKRKGNKKKFGLGGHNIDTVDDSPFKTFAEYFLSHEFFEWFTKTHLSYFKVKGEPAYVYDKNNPDFVKSASAGHSAGSSVTYYNTEVHYSSIECGGFIPPHTDSPKKRLSLVFYLPTEPVPKQMQENLGTVFYKVKKGRKPWKRFNSGLLDQKETQEFIDDHEIARTTTFEMNKCAGFIKSDTSWHAVAPNEFDYDRRAIVVNIHEIGNS